MPMTAAASSHLCKARVMAQSLLFVAPRLQSGPIFCQDVCAQEVL